MQGQKTFQNCCCMYRQNLKKNYFKIVVVDVKTRVELLPAFKFTGKMVNIKEFTGKW